MSVKFGMKRFVRNLLTSFIYRYPPFALAPERLYLMLHHIIQTKDVPGPIVEIGCNLGGTTIIAKRMMDGLGICKPYICIDTFDGFVDKQFATDVALGTPSFLQHRFSGNSKELVAKILRQHGCESVKLIKGDILTLPDEALPKECSLVLVDVDLTEPTFVSLQRLWPRLSPGGTALVDDCLEQTNWRARLGYSRFCRETNQAEQYQFGMGMLTHQ
jgi:O-methyltransferase